ncbi:DUF6170 family protein [Arsukibacterium indicum]|uniref:Uncharacterized protein n=1 Tax=Arsukibacterium indicum TaxID=2848612 RepID=A0ABS6MJR7_9GAMM|nr:DUF6170 family protein [Arsukibacterium indicum]MBV2128599.1 hypothetical protein [Arsukibacterium indicum]
MLYFSSHNIPELQGLNFDQRMQVVRAAADKLPTPTKVGLNTLKLIIIFGLFILVARAEGWAILGYALLIAPLYLLITRPITFALCQSRLSAVRQQIFAKNEAAQTGE